MPYGDGSDVICRRIPEERRSAGKGITIVGLALCFMLRRSWLRKRGTGDPDFVDVRNVYSDETGKSTVRTKPPNYPSLSLRTPILLLHLRAKESNTLKSTSAFLVLS